MKVKDMKKILTLLILCLSIMTLYCQTNNTQITSAIPPSPHVRNFLKYGDVPVSNHTGVPNIEIPIYTIQLKDIKLPISLSYNASGIKVEEESSRVGLGWVLNSGGMISVTVMGKHHDFTKWAYFTDGEGNNLHDITGLVRFEKYMLTGPRNTPPFNFRAMGMSEEIIYNALTTNEYGSCGGVELSPDIYNYNFGGYSGKFIFSHSGQIIKEKEDNVIIIPLKGKDSGNIDILKSWKAITPDGTEYYFEITERTTFTDRPSGENFNSCFYLSKIKTVNGSTIDFNYKKTKSALGRFTKAQDASFIGPTAVANYGYYDVVCLDNIIYSGGKIRFEYKYDREDYQPEPKLTTIYVDDETGNNKSKWIFDYDYFVANTTNETDYPTLNYLQTIMNRLIFYDGSSHNNFYTDSWNKKRLRLKKIIHKDNNNMPDESYSFIYEESKLPTKLSTSIDHWGYYNGAINYNLVPGFLQNISQTPGKIDVRHRGSSANREPNSQYNQAFLLKEITYPTGGKRKFSFESNTYDGNNFENDPYKKDYMYEGYGGTQNVTLQHVTGLNNAPVDWIQKEELKAPENAIQSWKTKLNIRVRITLDDSYNNRQPGPDKKFEMSIVSTDERKKPWFFTYQIPYIPVTINNSNRTFEKVWNDVESDFGNYEIRAVGTLRTYIREAEIKVERIVASPEFKPKVLREQIGGGLRISKIQHFNLNGEYISGKEYRYVKGNPSYGSLPSGETSGKLMFLSTI